jgi:hypothetical protein
MPEVQHQNTWNRTSVAVLLCAMTLTGEAGVGLGLSWRFGSISPSLLGLCFMVGTAFAAALLFYNRTNGSAVKTEDRASH